MKVKIELEFSDADVSDADVYKYLIELIDDKTLSWEKEADDA